MPILLEILAVVLILSLIGTFVSSSRKAAKREIDQEERLKELANSLLLVEDKNEKLEKRLKNVEMIVTDAKFVDPPTSGREAIDIKSELSELKQIIMKMKK